MFAVEALPVALSLSFTLAILFVVFKAADQREDELTERSTSMLNSQERVEWFRNRATRYRRISLMCSAIALAFIPLVLWIGRPLASLIVLVSCTSLHSVGAIFYPTILYSKFFVANYILTVSLLVTFAVGIDIQQRFVREGKAAHTISLEASELTGRIVRAGERSLLFYDPGSHEISFVRWETVKRIRTVPQT